MNAYPETRTPIWEQARDRWLGILPALGIDNSFLTGKAGPCPMCGGKDRFTFDDKDGLGTYICRNCGAGTGVQFVQRYFGVGLRDAALMIGDQIGTATRVVTKPKLSERHLVDLQNKLWLSSRSVETGDPVHCHFKNRIGEVTIPGDIRYAPRCRHAYGGYHPAMLAMVRDKDGNPCQIHRTYLTATGGKAPVEEPRRMMPGKHPPGSAVRLCEPGEVLGIAEGIETALAAHKLFDVPIWAALTASRLEVWEPPTDVGRIIIFADNDRNFIGQKAAYTLAARLFVTHEVEVKTPSEPGGDWNDRLRETIRGEAI